MYTEEMLEHKLHKELDNLSNGKIFNVDNYKVAIDKLVEMQEEKLKKINEIDNENVRYAILDSMIKNSDFYKQFASDIEGE